MARPQHFCRIETKVSPRPTPLRACPSDVPSHVAGEAFAFGLHNLSRATVSDELAPNTRSDEAKRGITIGILIVALLCLSLFFVWRRYNVAGSASRPVGSATSTH
jgi:hypothetical protein